MLKKGMDLLHNFSLILGSIFSGSIIVRFDFYLVLTSSSKEKTCHVVLAGDSANTSLI